MSIEIVKTNKYNGRYVALSDFKGTEVISSGKSAAKVHATAVKKGYKDPVLVYVPKKNEVHIY